LEQFINAKKKITERFYKRVSHNRSSANDPPCSLNRDHGPIGCDIIENLDLEKPSFRPSKWPRKLKPAKNSKLPKLPENCFEPVGKGGWPPISTWINPGPCRGGTLMELESIPPRRPLEVYVVAQFAESG
jgi:hypothetical protein